MTTSTAPTADNSSTAHATSSSVAAAPGATADAPSPTRAGVLGMTRSTGTESSPTAALMAAVVMPAATEITRLGVGRSATTGSTRWGFTATRVSTPPVACSATSTPSIASATRARCSADGSTTRTALAGAQPARTTPAARANPICPPPMIWSLVASAMGRSMAQRRRAQPLKREAKPMRRAGRKNCSTHTHIEPSTRSRSSVPAATRALSTWPWR